MSEQIKKPLPESLMKALTAIMQSPELTPQEKFEAAVLITHGYGLFTAASGSIDPTAYAIPETQWGAISDMLRAASRTTDPISQVNWALDWMNIGPSSYKEGQ
jgi:hypothetical protein